MSASLKVTAGGEPYDILPDEVEVRAQAKEGLCRCGGSLVAALVTELVRPSRVQEGQAQRVRAPRAGPAEKMPTSR